MNKRVFAILLLTLTTLFLGALVVSIRTIYVGSINSMSAVSSNIHSAYLNEIIYNFKNDLVSGNYRGFRNQISSLIDHDIFSDYEIVHNGKPVESSDTFNQNERRAEFIKVSVPIWFDENKTELWGSVDLLVRNSTRDRINHMILGKLQFFAFIFFMIFFVISIIYILSWQRINFLLSKKIENIFGGQANVHDDLAGRLWEPLINQLQELKTNHDTLLIKDFDDRQQKFLIEITRQVAHDIRSPLSALNMVSKFLDEVPTDKRSIITASIQRINDIANDLLVKGRVKVTLDSVDEVDGQRTSEPQQIDVNRFFLPELIENLILEKEVQFAERSGIQLSSDFQDKAEAFIEADSKEVSRLVSNILNNSIEAITGDQGIVTVSIRAYPDTILLIVTDNGKGMSPDILKRMGDKGFTYGKEGGVGGNGLGVFHAKKYIESIGGKFTLFSQVGLGTQVHIHFPRGKK